MTTPDAPAKVSLYEAHAKIYPRQTQGVFTTWRWMMVWVTQLVFYGTPWLQWHGRQAVLFALEERRFYIFNLVLYPQDFIYLTGLLVVSALSLFLFTAVAGRLWCGFACPQSVYSLIFLWIERRVEGDRSARIRLDRNGFDAVKLLKKCTKHALWLAVAGITGLSFVGYFTPIRHMVGDTWAGMLGPWQTFWVLFYGLATYGNAGFMREQVCKYMCPYARFQSAMFDKDTLIVTYDNERGEPRAPLRKTIPIASVAGTGAPVRGDCIDCSMCVQVCPTGIDIRNGLQYECIGCGVCIDACNGVMKQVGFPTGLIRFATQNGLQNHWTAPQMMKRIGRPRVLVYTAVLWSLIIALGISLYERKPLKVDVIRDRGTLARMVEQGRIENVYRLQLMNATEHDQHLRIGVQGIKGIAVASNPDMQVPATQTRAVAVRVQIPPESSPPPGSHPIQFIIETNDASPIRIIESAVFLVPR
jgi:cytochrome c oxidase accessory protein FixG